MKEHRRDMNRHHGKLKKLGKRPALFVLAIFMLLCVSYALVLPAVTLEQGSAEEIGLSEGSEPDTDVTLTFESEDLRAQARITDTEPVPEDVRLEVTPIGKDADGYEEYMAALNQGYDADTYNEDNSLLYDVSVMTEEGEYEPAGGRVDVTLQFLNGQLSHELGIDQETESSVQVIHLPEDGSKITREYVQDAAAEAGDSETVSFSVTSLSVITVSGAATDVEVNASLLGTDMQSLGYNLYAYLLANNDNTAYGARIAFTDGNASAVIPNVPPNTYKLYLVYARDNRELQERWNYGNVLDANTNNWVDTDGGYIFGYSARMPADKTITPSDNTIGFDLEVADVQSSINMNSIMDRAINYGITAEEIDYNVRAYTNFAAKQIDISNSNDQTMYGHRADGVDVVPNILAGINHNGQPLSTGDKPADYYVIEEDKDKVHSTHTTDTIIRNQNEIEDRVEIMLSNTLKQCSTLAANPSLILPKTTAVDVSPYADDATIILDATAVSKEPNGFTIVKRPGQTVVFNINGQNVAPPQNIKVKLVDKTGQQVDVDGNPSSKIYMAGDDMRDAEASEGNVWNKVIWNFPDAASVTASNCVGGIFLVPKGDFTVGNKGGGWIVARGRVSVTNEWYGFPGNDEPFKQKIIRKTFVGIEESEIDPDYAVKVWTNTNDSTSGTTHEMLITTLVLKPEDDSSLIKDPSGINDQTGYISKGTDADGNVVYEWRTPPLSVGNEHKLTEEHSTSTTGTAVELIDFIGPYSSWDEQKQDYVWEQREQTFTSEEEMEGIFNVSSHNEDYRQYVYVTNNYNIVKEPHDLTLTKKVNDPEGIEAAGQKYTFEISLKDEKGTDMADGPVTARINDGAEETLTVTGGKITVQLAGEDTIRLIDLPYGTQYSIRETQIPARCKLTFSEDTSSADEAAGRLIKDRSVTATNTYSDDPGVPVSAHKDLIDGVLENGQFAFRLVDAEGNLVRQSVNDTAGNISFNSLIFEEDGEYDYKLYEVADPSRKDIIYDPAEFDVHIKVTGGRAREVTYHDENGQLTAIPMFRNRKIKTDSDDLTARKVFIDADTGKAIELNGGEFTFTAVTNDEEPVTYTGTNDKDGMITFRDENGQPFDLENLTQPTRFTISETSGSYSGTLQEDQTISYDSNSYGAYATVDTKTVFVNPWTTHQVNNDTTELTVTFTPKDTSGTTYYTGGIFPPAYSHIRSDGTVTFTISVNKNNLQRDNQYHNYTFEYGKGDNYYYGRQAAGNMTVRARAGEWGQQPVEIEAVFVDGDPLVPTSTTVRTVELHYEDGAYPVFSNRLESAGPDTQEFPFTKVWVDNVTYADPQSWPQETGIDLTLTGTFHPQEAGAETTTREYTFRIEPGPDTGDGPAFVFTPPEGTAAPQIEATGQQAGENHYGFKITRLPKKDTIGGKEGEWTYYLKESSIEGYLVCYGDWDEEGSKAIPDQTIARRGIDKNGYLINAKACTELPSTGGPGTGLVYTFGLILFIGCGLTLLARRRISQ